MSVNKQITECFKMKKPRPSPAKDAARKNTVTPKRRVARKRLAQCRTPGTKTTSGDVAFEDNVRECEVDYRSRDPDLWLCSQDVPVSDIGWDYSSPRNKVMQVKKRDESDLANVMKLFRHGPTESEPNSGAWDIFKNDFVAPASSTKAAGSGTRKKQDNGAHNPQVLFERMQGLLQLIQENKNGGSDVPESSKCKHSETEAEDTTGAKVTAKNCCRGLLINNEEDVDEGCWGEGDESILVAASQEAEMVASPLQPAKTMGIIEEECVSLMYVSPLRRGTKGKSPRLRKSPRLQCLSVSRRSPLRHTVSATALASPVPKATERNKTPNRQRCTNAVENTNQSFIDLDDDDDLLDWVCSTYEQALQQQDAKQNMGSTGSTATVLPQQNSTVPLQAASTAFTVTNPTRCSARISEQAGKNATPAARIATPQTKRGETNSNQSLIHQNAKKVDSEQKLKVGNNARSTTLKAPSPLPKSGTAVAKPSGAGWEEDDDDFTTPDVMSWLEKVESQTSKSKKCTPEEIERKRKEALLRRQQRNQHQQQWKGRLRTSR